MLDHITKDDINIILQRLDPNIFADKSVLITGGAGFIGSHLADTLITHGNNVSVLDNLSNGSLQNIKQLLKTPSFTFIKGDLLNPSGLKHNHQQPFRTHKKNQNQPHTNLHLHIHSLGRTHKNPHTRNLRALKAHLNVRRLKTRLRSPHHSLRIHIQLQSHNLPLSQHGRPKKQARRHSRLHPKTSQKPKRTRNPRRRNPNKILPLHNRLHKRHTVGIREVENQVEIYNVGSKDQISVKTIAEIVVEEMGLTNVKFKFTGGVDGGRGWKGDVKNMLLDISKLPNP